MIIEVKNSGLVKGVDKIIPVQLSSNAVFAADDIATMKLVEAFSGCVLDTLRTQYGKIVLDAAQKIIYFKFDGEKSRLWKTYHSDDNLIRFYGTLYIEDKEANSRFFSGQQFKFYMISDEWYE